MSVVTVKAYRLVCDRCGEHDGQLYESPDDAVDNDVSGWTINDEIAVCVACNEHTRQQNCARTDGGHAWDTAVNRNLATMWASGSGFGSGSSLRSSPDTEFILRHCGRNCGRTEMRLRDGEWYGFDRWGWLGDDEEARVEKRRVRDAIFKIKKGETE